MADYSGGLASGTNNFGELAANLPGGGAGGYPHLQNLTSPSSQYYQYQNQWVPWEYLTEWPQTHANPLRGPQYWDSDMRQATLTGQGGVGYQRYQQQPGGGYVPAGYGMPTGPAAPTTPEAAAPTFEYPKPQTIWDQIYGLQPNQQITGLLGNLQSQLGLPGGFQQIGQGSGGPPGNQIHLARPGQGTITAPGGPTTPVPSAPGLVGGSGAGGGQMWGPAGEALRQQMGILQNMGTPESFISSTRPYIQDIMKGLGRSGLESSSLADRTVSNTLGDLWSRNQMNLAQGWQGLGNAYTGQVGNLINSWQNVMSGVGNLGQLWYHPYDQMLANYTYSGGGV
ncbi:MAG: hypothetical protein ACXABY_20665 [Candidatus Thorarchaeota archaeon]